MNTGTDISLRPITAADDAAMASVIRSVMPEFGASGPGFALSDAEVDHLTLAYSAPRSTYFVLERAGRVIGGAGHVACDRYYALDQ